LALDIVASLLTDMYGSPTIWLTKLATILCREINTTVVVTMALMQKTRLRSSVQQNNNALSLQSACLQLCMTNRPIAWRVVREITTATLHKPTKEQ